MKKINVSLRLFVVALLVLSLALVGCGPKEATGSADPVEPASVSFCFMEGSTALTAAKMIKENPEISKGFAVEYKVLNSTDLLVSEIMKEGADIAIVPSNLAAQAYNKGLSYRIAGTPTWGNIYIVGRVDVGNISELKGKEISTFGKGLTPDIILRAIFTHEGIDPDKDLTLSYLGAANEVAPYLLSGKTDLAVLPEPIVSSAMLKDSSVKVLWSLNDSWAEINHMTKGYPQSSLVIKKDLLDKNPEFVEAFLTEYEGSIKWAMEHPEELGQYSEELSLGPPAAAILKAKDRLGIGNFSLDSSKTEYADYFNAVFEASPNSIGGKVPDDQIFYKR